MIDETLTLGRAEQRIGDIVQKSTNILYPESPITIHWKTILALRDMLINEKLIKNILQLKKNNPYWEKKLITSKETGLRGAGLTRFANEKMPFVGFKYWSETSPQFKVIILETRKQFKKIKFEI